MHTTNNTVMTAGRPASDELPLLIPFTATSPELLVQRVTTRVTKKSSFYNPYCVDSGKNPQFWKSFDLPGTKIV
jgi:hypothetical protein